MQQGLTALQDIAGTIGKQPATARPYTFGIATLVALVTVEFPMVMKESEFRLCLAIGICIVVFGALMAVSSMWYDIMKYKLSLQHQASVKLHNEVFAARQSAHDG